MPQPSPQPSSPKSRNGRRREANCYHRNLRLIRLRRWLIAGLGALLALLLASTVPAYFVVRKWNLGRVERRAKEALAAGDFSEARRLAQEVLRENFANRGMLEVLHAGMVAQKDPAAAELAQSLLRSPDRPPEARLQDFREISETLAMASVLRSWLTLPAADRQRSGLVNAFVSRLIEEGMTGEADDLLRQNPQSAQDPELQLLQARVWLVNGSADDLDRAQKTIAGLMEQGGATALPAFRLLASIPLRQFRSGYFMEFGPWLAQQPGATPADRLLGRVQRLQRFPTEQASIAAEAVKNDGVSDPVACARWLRGLGMAREALELGGAADPAAWAPVKADLLADLGLWKELEDWLVTGPAGLTSVEIATRRAIAAEKRGDAPGSRSIFEAIRREAATVKSSNVLLGVSAQLKAAGLEEMSREALFGAVALRRGRLPLWSAVRPLAPWLRKADRGDRLAVLYQTMAEIDFTTPEPRLEAIDLGNLLWEGQNVVVLEPLDQLAQNFPRLTSEPRYHEVRATVLLGGGKAAEALAALNDPRQSNRLGSPRRTTVSALAKAALGPPPSSSFEALRESIPWQEMIREERQFFGELWEKMAAKAKGPLAPEK